MEKYLALASGACAVLAFLLGLSLRGRSGAGAAGAVLDGKRIEEERRAIENTPAADLVDAAPNAADLHANAETIAGRFRQRLRDRAGKILSGDSSGGTNGNG
ncbi:MAG: hypothetical protein LBK63_04970 [Treponema sp.]|nr:hypothetical protein [Treponema sp.]